MASGNKPKCIRIGCTDRLLSAELIPAHVEHEEIRSGSGPLYPVTLTSLPVKAGVWISCGCGFEGAVEAPKGWRPEEE